MISKAVLCDDVFVVFFFKTVYNKTILRFVFCDVWNGQGRGKCSASADNTSRDLDYSGYHICLIK